MSLIYTQASKQLAFHNISDNVRKWSGDYEFELQFQNTPYSDSKEEKVRRAN